MGEGVMVQPGPWGRTAWVHPGLAQKPQSLGAASRPHQTTGRQWARGRWSVKAVVLQGQSCCHGRVSLMCPSESNRSGTGPAENPGA